MALKFYLSEQDLNKLADERTNPLADTTLTVNMSYGVYESVSYMFNRNCHEATYRPVSNLSMVTPPLVEQAGRDLKE